MSTYKYERYLSHLAGQAWAITPEYLAIVRDLMMFRAAGHRFTDEEIEARVGSGGERRTSRRDGTVAVIPIHGVILHRANTLEAISGGTSTEALSRVFANAIGDDSIKAILLDVSSPGGTVQGVGELAAQILEARKVKPVFASANANAGSAAYWLASQADELTMIPSGMVGSIGVFAIFEDISEHLAKEGIKINAISAGENKIETAPFMPMGDEARAHIQAQVDGVYRQFVSDVARGRRKSQATVRETFGQGRMFMAAEALKRGMVDAVETFDETLARLVNKRVSVSGGARAEGDQEINSEGIFDELHVHADVSDTLAAATGTREEVIAEVLDASQDAAVEFHAETMAATDALIDNINAQREADLDYADAAIRIAERL